MRLDPLLAAPRLTLQQLGDLAGALGIRVNAEVGVDAGGHDVVADGNCLFRHPFRRAAAERNLGNVDAPILCKIGSQDHHTGDIHAGAHMQDRRDADQLAHAAQTLAAVFGGVEIHETCLGGSLCRAAGDDDDDIVLEELLHKLDVGGVGADLGVVAADHRHCAAQDARLDDIRQRLQRAERVDMGVADAVELFLDGLDRVADTGLGLEVRDVDKLGLAVLEVLDRHLDDRLGVVRRGILMELDEIGVRHAGDGGSGDELGVEALRQRAECREDALHVDDDGFAVQNIPAVFYNFLLFTAP